MNHTTESNFVAHEPCPVCGSRDNLARFDDGHAYCFGCQHYESRIGGTHREQERRSLSIDLITDGVYADLKKRGISV